MTALFPGEKPADYEALEARVVAAVAPKDGLEEFWVEDVTVLIWEMQRLRRIKAGIIRAAMPDALEAILKPVTDSATAASLVNGWRVQDANAQQQVDGILELLKMTMDDVAAYAVQQRIKHIDKINTMIMQAQARRNSALREIERHRDLLAARLREAAAIEDAESQEAEFKEVKFKEVETEGVEGAAIGHTGTAETAVPSNPAVSGPAGDGWGGSQRGK